VRGVVLRKLAEGGLQSERRWSPVSSLRRRRMRRMRISEREEGRNGREMVSRLVWAYIPYLGYLQRT
jgi:hypothetical protein